MLLPNTRNGQLFYPNWKKNIAGTNVWSFYDLSVNCIDYLKGIIRKSFQWQCSVGIIHKTVLEPLNIMYSKSVLIFFYSFCGCWVNINFVIFQWIKFEKHIGNLCCSRNGWLFNPNRWRNIAERHVWSFTWLVNGLYWLFKSDYKKVLSMTMF